MSCQAVLAAPDAVSAVEPCVSAEDMLEQGQSAQQPAQARPQPQVVVSSDLYQTNRGGTTSSTTEVSDQAVVSEPAMATQGLLAEVSGAQAVHTPQQMFVSSSEDALHEAMLPKAGGDEEGGPMQNGILFLLCCPLTKVSPHQAPCTTLASCTLDNTRDLHSKSIDLLWISLPQMTCHACTCC